MLHMESIGRLVGKTYENGSHRWLYIVVYDHSDTMERLLFIIHQWWICYNAQDIVPDQFHGLSGLQYEVSLYYKTYEAKYHHTVRCLSSITLYIYKFNYSNLFLPIFIQLTHWRRFFFFVSEYVIRNIFSVYVRTQNTTGLYSFISDQLKSLDGFSVISDLFLSCGCCLLDLSVVGGVIGSCLGILVAVTWPQSL